MLIATFYRHTRTNSDRKFNENLINSLHKLRNENKLIIITGDFNYDLLKFGNYKYIDEFVNIMYNNHLAMYCGAN